MSPNTTPSAPSVSAAIAVLAVASPPPGEGLRGVAIEGARLSAGTGGRYRALRTCKSHASIARSVCVRLVKARGVYKQPTAVPWNFMSQGHRVAVVGATGQVGSLMLRLLRERGFPAREVVAFASPRSAGRVLAGAAPDGGDLTVQDLGEDTIQGFDLALFSAGGSTSGEWAPRFADAGAVVVDNSSRWRMHDDVPLVVAEVNPDALAEHRGIVANPNCSTMQMVVALKPLHVAAGIERLVISTYQAVSGTGKAAVDELLDQSHALLAEMGMCASPLSAERAIEAPSAYAHQIAFNALPHAGSFAPGDDHTDEERKLINETRKILGDPAIRVSATCVRVPVVNGHSEAVNVQTREPLSPERTRELLAAAPGVTVLDDPGAALYPLAIDATGKDDVFVGRIRRDPGHERALDLWIVADNLRKGAATNAVQIAELLHTRGLIRPSRERRRGLKESCRHPRNMGRCPLSKPDAPS